MFSDYPDEDAVPDNVHVKPDEIGTIAVWVFLVENRRRLSGGLTKFEITDRPPVVINERVKKAGGHCVS